jgi:streptogramin lyase
MLAAANSLKREDAMRNLGLALALIGLVGLGSPLAQAQTALSGTVASAEEGAMEGVVVSAKADGSTMTVSMVSDAQGRYAFPAARLAPGHYALAIRAIGYELDGPGAIDIAPGKAASADLKLRKTKEVWRQLSNAEWLASIPGSDDQKKFLLNCVGCHTLQRIVTSTHDAAEFEQVIHRMTRYYPGSTPVHPQILAGTFARDGAVGNGADYAQVAKYLASINLSGGSSWEYPLKPMPRSTGRATHVVVTEYALPRATMEPHDVILDQDGMVWFSNFGEQFLSKMDPATGKVTEFPIPELKPGFPTGTLDLEADPDGNLWVGLMFQAGIAKFDKKTETFTLYAAPKEIQGDGTQLGMVTPTHANVDGVVWAKDAASNSTLRLNVASGTFENLGVVKDPSGRPLGAYGIPSNAANELYFLNFGGSEIGRFDAKTAKLVIYPTPTARSRPRRGRVDGADRLWFAEYAANSIAMFDPKTEQIKEWKAPIPWTSPYDVVPAKNGEVWTASMFTDRVTRLDPATGAFTDYPLPRQTNIRRVFASNDGAVWFGSVHGAAIVKVEPLD